MSERDAPAPLSGQGDSGRSSPRRSSLFISLPGFGGSGPDHWQSIWEADDPAFRRFAPSSWHAPELDDWVAALDTAVSRSPSPPTLVAHSLACLLVAHWAARTDVAIAGAFLVSVPDPAGPNFPREAASFRDVPEENLRFPTLILASNDDAYGDVAHARRRARQWGATLIELGPLGHINAASGLGAWDHGRQLLAAFAAGHPQPPPTLHQ